MARIPPLYGPFQQRYFSTPVTSRREISENGHVRRAAGESALAFFRPEPRTLCRAVGPLLRWLKISPEWSHGILTICPYGRSLIVL